MTLQYPGNASADSDYVIFEHFEYRPNNMAGRGGFAGKAVNPPSEGKIRLYTPESTPQTSNQNMWQRTDFEGPAGLLKQNLLRGITGGGFGNAAKQLPGAIGQGILDTVAGQFGMSASQITALKGGEVYNPNVELLYSTPVLRAFDFQFRFLPSNTGEASTVREIIRQFKMWSSPEIAKGGDMFNVPHLWQVTYMGPAGDASQFMGKFKKCALTSVVVQANTSSAYHTTFSDGNPIEYSLGLGFQEVDVITRENHEEVAGGIGY